MTQLDSGSNSILLEIQENLQKLGIDAEVITNPDRIGKTNIIFENTEDMNLYKAIGKWNNFWWLQYSIRE